jgi:hypothetical protein
MKTNIKLKCDSKSYTVSLAEHLFEHRETLKGTSKSHRTLHIDNKRYKQIFTIALKNGLTSFRNKGVVVVTFRDTYGKAYGVLCDLKDNNDIFVISVFRGPKRMDINRCFIKVHNRINLSYYYIMDVLTDEERTKNKLKRTSYYVEKDLRNSDDDKEFLRAMKSVKIV